MIRFTFKEQNLSLCKKSYKDGSPAVVVHNESGSRYLVLSVNVPGTQLAHDEVLIKTWAENKDVAAAVLATGLFADTGRRIPSGFAEAQVWKLTSAEALAAISCDDFCEDR